MDDGEYLNIAGCSLSQEDVVEILNSIKKRILEAQTSGFLSIENVASTCNDESRIPDKTTDKQDDVSPPDASPSPSPKESPRSDGEPKTVIYAEWLGIPTNDSPPDHYALLGLERFESDTSVIEKAAAERTRLVRPKSLKYPQEATRLLNEIASAKICLLNADTKAEYDSTLRQDSDIPDLAHTSEGVVRFCPHCARKLLMKETLCRDCSRAEAGDPLWLSIECQSCRKHMPPGVIVCRSCGSDHALPTRPSMPAGIMPPLKPFFAAKRLEPMNRSTGAVDREPDEQGPGTYGLVFPDGMVPDVPNESAQPAPCVAQQDKKGELSEKRPRNAGMPPPLPKSRDTHSLSLSFFERTPADTDVWFKNSVFWCASIAFFVVLSVYPGPVYWFWGLIVSFCLGSTLLRTTLALIHYSKPKQKVRKFLRRGQPSSDQIVEFLRGHWDARKSDPINTDHIGTTLVLALTVLFCYSLRWSPSSVLGHVVRTFLCLLVARGCAADFSSRLRKWMERSVNIMVDILNNGANKTWHMAGNQWESEWREK